jgi:hypothetical protein
MTEEKPDQKIDEMLSSLWTRIDAERDWQKMNQLVEDVVRVLDAKKARMLELREQRREAVNLLHPKEVIKPVTKEATY